MLPKETVHNREAGKESWKRERVVVEKKQNSNKKTTNKFTHTHTHTHTVLQQAQKQPGDNKSVRAFLNQPGRMSAS
jgi:hypothetical protein